MRHRGSLSKWNCLEKAWSFALFRAGRSSKKRSGWLKHSRVLCNNILICSAVWDSEKKSPAVVMKERCWVNAWMGTYWIIHIWCFGFWGGNCNRDTRAAEIWKGTHSTSCELQDNVRSYYIRSAERFIWDPAKFSPVPCFSVTAEAWTGPQRGQTWSEETLNNSHNKTCSLSMFESDHW